MQPGDIVKLNQPDTPQIAGQGPRPAGIRYNGTFVPYGEVLKLSNKCKFPANLAADEPLIHIDFANEIADQLTLISESKEKEDE